MLKFLKTEAQRFMKYMRNEKGFLQFLPLALSAGAAILGSKDKGSSEQSSGNGQAGYYNTFSPGQIATDQLLSRILTEGAAPYEGQRVAGLTGNEQAVQQGSRQAFDQFLPAITRILSGQFPEEYFNQAVADPTRRQFNDRVAPVIRENSALTGNRFADRSAIEMGQARGDVESSILQQRGQWGQEAMYAPAKYGTSITNALAGFGNIAALDRQVQQQQLDAQFEEWMRTNPMSGGQIPAMINYLTGVKQYHFNEDEAAGGGGVQSNTLGRSASNFIPQVADMGLQALTYALQGGFR